MVIMISKRLFRVTLDLDFPILQAVGRSMWRLKLMTTFPCFRKLLVVMTVTFFGPLTHCVGYVYGSALRVLDQQFWGFGISSWAERQSNNPFVYTFKI